MPIRQSVRDLEKRLAACSRIRVFEFPMEEKGQVVMPPDPVGLRECRLVLDMPDMTAMKVLKAWTAAMERSF